ncbi:PfkB family carbohydrate kinase [Streptomyces sp. NPDC001832]|uniref:PfkB family carbohydrate kinase n=1 Tax=Streptomyces sp. NPDC001832 TaxID=3154527 RepID=UPI00332729D9
MSRFRCEGCQPARPESGEKGSRINRAEEPAVDVPAVPEARVADPTGGGDAFRAGYLTSLAAGLDAVQCAQTGSVLAALALSAVDTQTYNISLERIPTLLASAYGPA